MPTTNGSKVDLKIQKRRRRSLDESLINPFKAFVVSARLRRQSTTDASSLEKSTLYNDRRRRRSENEYFWKLPIQDTTKERLMSVVSRSSSLKDEKNKQAPKILRQISRHLTGRRSFSEYEEEKRRNSIHEIPKDSDETSSSGETHDSIRHVRKQFDRMSFDASSLSTVDSGVGICDEKNLSSDDMERSDDGDSLDGNARDKLVKAPGTNLNNRSLSADDVTDNVSKEPGTTDDNTATPSTVHRQYSLRESNYPKTSITSVSNSPVIIRTSQEKLYQNRDDINTDEKLQNVDSSFNSKGSLRKKKLLGPLAIRLRKTSRSDSFDMSPKLKALDSSGLEQIVSDILHEKMKGLNYDHALSKERCRNLSTIIEKTLKVRLSAQPGSPEYKIVALVYIGETEDDGIFFATQCSYQPSDDLFATATYQNKEMYVCVTVIATFLPKAS